MDQSTDRDGRGLVKVALAFEMPDYVKSASRDAVLGDPPPRTACADPTRQRLWCHTKASTWLSAGYLAMSSDYAPAEKQAIETRLIEFARVWGIEPDVKAILAPPVKAAAELTDDDFAYVWKGENGVVARHMPVRNAAEVKAAAGYLEQYRDRFSYADRRPIAQRILTKAAAYGVEFDLPTGEFLDRQVGNGRGIPDAVVAACQSRALRAQAFPDEVKTAADKIAARVQADPYSIVGNPVASALLVSALEDIDRSIKIAGNYNESMLRPEDVIYAITRTKVASVAPQLVGWPDGRTFTRDELAKVARAELVETLGMDVTKQACDGFVVVPEKLATVAAQLPAADIRALNGLFDDLGVTPVDSVRRTDWSVIAGKA